MTASTRHHTDGYESQTERTAVAAAEYARARIIGGALLFGVGFLAFMGIITAEAFYPGYNAGVREISDLGASRPPNSVILQPSATIFNTTMILSGLGVLAAAYFLHRAYGDRVVTAVVGLLGVGILGVGIFDGSEAPMHGLFALLTFATGGLSAVVATRILETPFRVVSAAIGGFVLLLLGSVIALGLLGIPHPLAFLGMGGLERYVTYPFLLWLLGFGGHLMGSGDPAGTPR